VHIIDVVGETHEGYVAPPGTLRGPRGLAARGNLVAVSTATYDDALRQGVHIFEGSGTRWSALRIIDAGFQGAGDAYGRLLSPRGLRFTADGMGLVVVDGYSKTVNMFRVEDGSFVRHVVTSMTSVNDVEEWEGGWLVSTSFPATITFMVDGEVHSSMECRRNEFGRRYTYKSMAFAPGLGLFVRDSCSHTLQLYATHDDIAMASMSDVRVEWMAAVARGTEARRRRAGVVRAEGSSEKRPRV